MQKIPSKYSRFNHHLMKFFFHVILREFWTRCVMFEPSPTSQLFPAKFSGHSHTSTPRIRVSGIAGCNTFSSWSTGLPSGGGTAVSSVRPKILKDEVIFPEKSIVPPPSFQKIDEELQLAHLLCSCCCWYIALTRNRSTPAKALSMSALSAGVLVTELYQPEPSLEENVRTYDVMTSLPSCGSNCVATYLIGICTVMFSRGKKSMRV